MKTVNKIYLALASVGLPIIGCFIALGWIEPYVSIPTHTAYGWDYWPWLILLVVCFTFAPVLYILANQITVKYGRRKITTRLTIRGFWIRFTIALIGVVLIGIVLEDALSLVFAELIRSMSGLPPAGVFAADKGFLWSAMGDLAGWIGLSPAYFKISGWQIPTLYPVFLGVGVILIILALVAPRWRR